MSVRSLVSDRRLECRYGTPFACTVITGRPSASSEQAAALLDVSQSGALLLCRKGIPFGTKVRLRLDAVVYEGQIVRARKQRTGLLRRVHLLGVRTVAPWPAEIFARLAFPEAGMQTIARVADVDDLFDEQGLW